jgi:membrane-associated phospholipid phosphatase
LSAPDPLLDAQRFRIMPPGWIMGVWLVLLVVAVVLDTRFEAWLRVPETAPLYHFAKHESRFWWLVKQPGEWWFTGFVMLMLVVLHRRGWQASLLLLLGCVISALITATIKWVTGRTRPIVRGSEPFEFDWFRGGLDGLVDQTNLAMPSGHVTMAFATASCMIMLVPRGWWIWLIIACLCAIERVMELAHHPSDVVVGAMSGVLGFRLGAWLVLVRPLALSRYTRPHQVPRIGSDPVQL